MIPSKIQYLLLTLSILISSHLLNGQSNSLNESSISNLGVVELTENGSTKLNNPIFSSAEAERGGGLKIIRADSVYTICDTQQITLEKDSFSFIFYLYDYNNKKDHPNTISIHCSLNKNDFNFEEGQSIDSILYFSLGSGIATEHSKPYKSLYINNVGQHYIMYSKLSTMMRRAILLEEKDNKLFKLKWKITTLFFENKAYSLNDIPINKLFLVAFSDKNNNRILDKGEFLRFTLLFDNNE